MSHTANVTNGSLPNRGSRGLTRNILIRLVHFHHWHCPHLYQKPWEDSLSWSEPFFLGTYTLYTLELLYIRGIRSGIRFDPPVFTQKIIKIRSARFLVDFLTFLSSTGTSDSVLSSLIAFREESSCRQYLVIRTVPTWKVLHIRDLLVTPADRRCVAKGWWDTIAFNRDWPTHFYLTSYRPTRLALSLLLRLKITDFKLYYR